MACYLLSKKREIIRIYFIFDCTSIKKIWKDIQETTIVTCGVFFGGVWVVLGTERMVDWHKRENFHGLLKILITITMYYLFKI